MNLKEAFNKARQFILHKMLSKIDPVKFFIQLLLFVFDENRIK